MCGDFSPTKVPFDKFGSLTSGQLSPTSLASTFYRFLGGVRSSTGKPTLSKRQDGKQRPPPITSSACNKIKKSEELFILWVYLLFQQSFSSSCRINTFEIVTKLPVTLQTKKPWPTVVALDKGLHSCACFLCRPHSAKMIIHPVGRPGRTHVAATNSDANSSGVSSNVPENPKMPGWKSMAQLPYILFNEPYINLLIATMFHQLGFLLKKVLFLIFFAPVPTHSPLLQSQGATMERKNLQNVPL